MKSKKIIFMLLLLCAAVAMLASCDVSSNSALDCLEPGDMLPVYDNVYQIDGKVVSSNSEYNIVAIESEEAYSSGSVQKTVTAYDLVTKTVICSDNVSLSHSGDPSNPSISMDVSQYPIICITKNWPSYNSEYDIYEDNYSYTYMLAGGLSNTTLLYGSNESYYRVERVGDLYIAALPDAVYWINSNSEIIRKQNADIADSYLNGGDLSEYFEFDAEYNGYLYSWVFDQINRSVMIYDESGVCVVQYNHSNDTVYYEDTDAIINPVVRVLNNGNVLVQECYLAKDDEDCELIYRGNRINYATKIVNCITGEVTEVEFGGLIIGAQSRYDMLIEEGTALAAGYENIIMYAPVVNKTVSSLARISVVDNNLSVVAEFVNDDIATVGVDSCDDFLICDNYYVVPMEINGAEQVRVYDFSGKLIKSFSGNILGYTEEYIIFNSGIYSYSGECVYSFEGSVLEGAVNVDPMCGVSTNGRSIYVSAYNYSEGVLVTYLFDAEKKELSLLADGEDVELYKVGKGYTVLKNVDNNSYTLVNAEGVAILKTQDAMEVISTEDCLYVMSTVNSEPVVYVINNGTVMNGGEK